MKSNYNRYICVVDSYRRPSRRRNTAGRYLVCAKTEKQAKDILQEKIGFGSVQILYQVTSDHGFPIERETPLDCKSAVKMEIDEKYNWVLVPIRHATDSLSETVDMDEMER